MPENYLFEYAVMRIVPRPEREEFLNVGVILYCKSLNYLNLKYHLDSERLLSLCPKVSLPEISMHLMAYEGICLGTNKISPIAKFDKASRFRWLTATRSTVIQSSKVHPGLTSNPQKTLEKIFIEMVG